MSTITKIEIVLGHNTTTWMEIDPSSIPARNSHDTIRTAAKSLWQDARETRSIVEIYGGYRLCTVTITTKTCFGDSKQTFSI